MLGGSMVTRSATWGTPHFVKKCTHVYPYPAVCRRLVVCFKALEQRNCHIHIVYVYCIRLRQLGTPFLYCDLPCDQDAILIEGVNHTRTPSSGGGGHSSSSNRAMA